MVDIAKPDISIDPRILESAKNEFMKMGFKEASLQNICKNAGVTTGALYNRYSGKSELFDAVVMPVMNDLKLMEEKVIQRNWSLMDNQQLEEMWNITEDFHKMCVDFFYERYDGMRLLFCCSEGTKYSNFIHEFSEKNKKITLEFIAEAKRRNLSINHIDEDELHILLTSYWTAVFEAIIHEFPREKAISFYKTITKFFNWKEVFGF